MNAAQHNFLKKETTGNSGSVISTGVEYITDKLVISNLRLRHFDSDTLPDAEISRSVITAIFPGEPGLAWVLLELRMMEVVVITGAISREKLQSNCRQQQTNIKFVTGRMPFLSPNQQCQSTEEKRDAEIHVAKDSAAEQQRIALCEAPH